MKRKYLVSEVSQACLDTEVFTTLFLFLLSCVRGSLLEKRYQYGGGCVSENSADVQSAKAGAVRITTHLTATQMNCQGHFSSLAFPTMDYGP